MCSVEEFSDSENILLQQNDSITIKCSFQYSADESCIVTPIWTDLTGYRDLTIPDDDFEVNMDDKHAWIHFKPGADVRNGTHFSLSFAFKCSSFKNNSQDKLVEAKHNFGRVPFTILSEGTIKPIINCGLSLIRLVTIYNILFCEDKSNLRTSTEFTEPVISNFFKQIFIPMTNDPVV